MLHASETLASLAPRTVTRRGEGKEMGGVSPG